MARKLKVLVVGPTPPPYHGVATFTRDLLRATHPAIELIPLDTSDRRDTSNIGRWDGENLALGFSHQAQLAERIPRSEIDVVYIPLSQNVPAFLRDALYIIQSNFLGARVVIHLHGGYFRHLYEQESGAFFRGIAKAALRNVSAAIVLGDEFRPIFSGLIPDGRIHVVENGVPSVNGWHGSRPPPPPDGGTLLYMSTLTRTKGILELLYSMAKLRIKRPKIKLRIAGEWQEKSLRQEAEALIDKEHLQSNVEFTSTVSGDAKARFLNSGDIFCLLTRYPYEGQPLSILEALSAGLPVLTTAHATLPSTVPDGLAGRTMPISTPVEEWAHVIDEMLTDPEKLHEYAVAARARYSERYTLDACHARLFKVFEGLTSGAMPV